MFDVEQRGPNEGFPTLDRWVLNPKTGKQLNNAWMIDHKSFRE